MLDEAPRIHAVPRPGSFRLRAARLAGGLRCPFCHEAPGEQERASVCRACFAPHHAACWDEHGACSACGSERRLGELGVAGAARALGPAVLLAVLSVPLGLLAALLTFVTVVLAAERQWLGALFLGGLALVFGVQTLCNLVAFAGAIGADGAPPRRAPRRSWPRSFRRRRARR